MEASTKERLTDRTIWVRALYMLLFALVYTIAETILVFVAIFQLISVLITGGVNEALQRFGGNLSAYCYGIFRFQTFNSEDLPFPFADWPDIEPDESPWNDDDDDDDEDEDVYDEDEDLASDEQAGDADKSRASEVSEDEPSERGGDDDPNKPPQSS